VNVILVIDTETTGLDPATAEVIELAGIIITETGQRASGWWSTLIRPQRPIPPETSAIHHLTIDDFDGDLFCCSTLKEAWRYAEKMLVTCYAAHNAEFDRSFVRDVCDPEVPWLCTYRVALHLWPDAPGHGNQVLRYYLGLKPDLPPGLAPHRAAYDAIVTAGILGEALKLKPLSELSELQHKPILLKTCSFGKYAKSLWKDVPKDYLQWIVRTGDFNIDIMHTAKHYLQDAHSKTLSSRSLTT
jgi:exodeoxyribonuclease X